MGDAIETRSAGGQVAGASSAALRVKPFAIWLGRNRVVAALLGYLSGGLLWALACSGRTVDDESCSRSVVALWREAHGVHLQISAALHVLMYGLLIWALLAGSGVLAGLPFAFVCLVALAASVEMLLCFRSGSDPFGWLPQLALSGPSEPEGWLTPKLSEATRMWPLWGRVSLAGLWTWCLGSIMLSCAAQIVILYLFFLLLGALLESALSSGAPTRYIPARRYTPAEPDVPPVFGRSGEQIQRRSGGPFADVVATVEGNLIKEGYGGPLANVIATIEGNQIKRGYGGPMGDVMYTVVGNEIRSGYGGPLGDVVAVLDGKHILAGRGGLFADVLYTRA